MLKQLLLPQLPLPLLLSTNHLISFLLQLPKQQLHPHQKLALLQFKPLRLRFLKIPQPLLHRQPFKLKQPKLQLHKSLLQPLLLLVLIHQLHLNQFQLKQTHQLLRLQQQLSRHKQVNNQILRTQLQLLQL